MMFRRVVLVTGAALALAGTAKAQDYMGLARQLHSEGYENQATVRVRGDKLHVEVSGSAGRTERVYSRDGSTLFEEETVRSDGWKVEREFDAAGNLLEEEVEVADNGVRDHGKGEGRGRGQGRGRGGDGERGSAHNDRDDDDWDDDRDEDDRDEDDRDDDWDDDRDEDDRDDDDRDDDEDDDDDDEDEDDRDDD